MEWIITLVGLAVVAAGVYLSWHKKGHEAWATYLFGFALVVISGPLSSQLSTLSISEKGVNISLKQANLSTEEVAKIEGVAAKSIGIELAVKSTGGSSAAGDSATSSIQKNFIEYFQYIGYIPTQLVGSEGLSPGSVITYKDGKPWLLATSSEAFPGLEIKSALVTLPQFSVKTQGPNSSGTDDKVATATNFWCKSATSQSVSLAALKSTANDRIISSIENAGPLLVVQDVIICSQLSLATERDIAGPKDSAEKFLYESETPVVLGYRVASLAISKDTK